MRLPLQLEELLEQLVGEPGDDGGRGEASSIDGCDGCGDRGLQVLSVVVLAGGGNGGTGMPKGDNSRAGGDKSISGEGSRTAQEDKMVSGEGTRGNIIAGCGGESQVLAERPLLLLPPPASLELQAVFEAAVEAGNAPNEAYQLLLPVLRNWAVLLCQQLGSGAEAGAEDLQGMQHVRQAVFASLEGFFTQFGMRECLMLLRQQQ
jgi:hypothetical protein